MSEQFSQEKGEQIQYPGKNPLEILKSNEALPPKGIMFSLSFRKGHEATGHIIVYEELINPPVNQGDESVFLTVKGRDLYFSVESPNYPHKSTEPYDRLSTSTYIPHSFSDLEEVATNAGGRALILKQAWPANNLGYTVVERKGSEFSRVIDENKFDQLKSVISIVLQEEVGLSKDDAERVAQEVVTKCES